MSEVRQVQTNQVDQKCPACGNGWMRPNGVVQTTNPPQYDHACTNCGHTQTYGMRFPYTV
jgi:predicted RNA-binding Zn-ribbon protein involved in translation (DUF1610 family)